MSICLELVRGKATERTAAMCNKELSRQQLCKLVEKKLKVQVAIVSARKVPWVNILGNRYFLLVFLCSFVPFFRMFLCSEDAQQ